MTIALLLPPVDPNWQAGGFPTDSPHLIGGMMTGPLTNPEYRFPPFFPLAGELAVDPCAGGP